jgi:hypothetical protein
LNAKADARTKKKLLSPRNDLDFVRTFAPDALMLFPLSPKDRGIILSAMGVMTVGITRFFPDLVGRDNLEIIVAGAALPELTAAAYGVDVMRHWLQAKDVIFQFCGLGIDSALEKLSSDLMMGRLAEWNIANCMLAHLMWKRRAEHIPLPDIITVLHPGIEYSRECWLKDEGLREAAENGVPILLSAFAEREMCVDRMALEAYGYELSEPFQHRGAPRGMLSEESGESADPDPRYGAWLYAITGVDAKRWRQPDKKLLAKAFAGSRPELLFAGTPQRKQVVGMLHAGHRGGNAYARMEDGVRLKNTSRETNHPLFFSRFQLQSVLLGHADPNDYYAGQLLRYGAGLGVEFVMPYLAANPDALEARDEEGRTVVFHAIEYGGDAGLANTNLLAQLVNAADLGVVDDQALTPLQFAVQRNNLRAIDLLLKAGAPIVSPPGAREMVEFLVDEGAWRLLQRLVSQDSAAAERAAANPVLIPRMLNAGAPAPLVKRFRALERARGAARSPGSETAKQRPEGDVLAVSAAAAVKLMLAGHSLLRWTGSLGLGEPTNVAEVELAAELGDAELHQAIRAAEKTGEKLHGNVITLYGAMVRLIVTLLDPNNGDESLVKGVRKSMRKMDSATADAGFLPDNAFRERALMAHIERHEARYSAPVEKSPDLAATGRKKAATAKTRRRSENWTIQRGVSE